MLKVNMFSILIKSEVMRKAPPRPDMLPSPGLGRRPSHKRSRCFLVDSWSCGSHPCSHRAVDRSKAEAASALYIWGKVQRADYSGRTPLRRRSVFSGKRAGPATQRPRSDWALLSCPHCPAASAARPEEVCSLTSLSLIIQDAHGGQEPHLTRLFISPQHPAHF